MNKREHKKITIDTGYLKDQLAAAYLLVDGDEAVFIENNTGHAVGRLLDALNQEGLSPDQVRYVVVTHVHLDHAGGTGELMSRCPNATLLVHKSGARHMVSPDALIKSAIMVYGKERFGQLYGEVLPVPEDRVEKIEDGDQRDFGRSTLEFFYSHGHAYHHMSVVDHGSDSIFSGDSFGLYYPPLQEGGMFIYPATTPTQFDSSASIETVHKTTSYGKATIYPTHFGPLKDQKEAKEQLITDLQEMEGYVQRISEMDLSGKELMDYARTTVNDYYMKKFETLKGRSITATERAYLEMDLELNGQGIAIAAEKKRASVS